MSIHRLKNGVCFCANKGCKHLMSVKVEIKGKNERGNYVTKKRFNLCEECAWEILKEVDYQVIEK